MKYEFKVTQKVDHSRNDGTTWESEEVITGNAHDTEELIAAIGIITSMFTKTTIEISANADDKEDE